MSVAGSNVVRMGIVGVGGMGSAHAKNILEGKVPGAVLGAVCDAMDLNFDQFKPAKVFRDVSAMMGSGEIDAILIATPHFSHVAIGIEALEKGLHVLVEKPIGVHKADCEKLLAAHKNPQQVFAAMFNQRTDPGYVKIRSLIQSGELGKVRRINWIITNWFRTEAYYASGGWRATWAGEGGGVLLNQCPHNLDLYQWLFGMPLKVRAYCQMGRYHNIEVEDDVTAYLEHSEGTTGVFVASTGEAPGTNRLEIAGERGRVVFEKGLLEFIRNEQEMSEFSRTTKLRFDVPPVWNVTIPISGNGPQHVGIMQNFVSAILEGTPLIAPAKEGIFSVELANAMLLSTFEDNMVELPMDAKLYEKHLNQRIAQSKYKK